MYPEPYAGIYPAIEEVLRELVRPEDRYHNTHLRRIARTLHIFLEQEPQGLVLEIGTGGVIPLALKALRPDLDVIVTNFAEDKPQVHDYEVIIGRHFGRFPAYRVDLEYDEIPVPDEHVDWVLCCEVIEHMEIDPMFMMSEINRITKINGGLLVTTPNITSSRALTKIIRGYEPHFYMQYHASREYHRHNYEYSVHSLMAVIKASGYEGKIWTEDNFEAGLTDIPERLKKAGFDLQHLGDNIITVAHKISEVVERYPLPIYDTKQAWHE